MSSFTRLDAAIDRVRIVQVGAGAMGRAWLRLLADSSEVELVGLVDLDTALASRALADLGIEGVLVGGSLRDVATGAAAHAIVDVTVPRAHLSVNVEAMRLGMHVLCEKPIAESVAEAQEMARVAIETGSLLMTSQSRRYYRSLTMFREQVRRLGEIGSVTTQFFKAPRFGGFREEMRHVLLLDMAIHAFDAARYLLERDPIAVYCRETNPGWSWFAHGANAVAVFEFDGGATYSYTGSWCAPGQETTWNGSWRVSGANGTAVWDGEGMPVVDPPDLAGEPIDGPEEIAGALAEFVAALRTGDVPASEVRSNLVSLAMVEAAVVSAGEERRVTIAEVIG